jgi:hypothetical protein
MGKGKMAKIVKQTGAEKGHYPLPADPVSGAAFNKVLQKPSPQVINPD